MGQYFSINLERFDDKSMAFVLSMMANNPTKTATKESTSGSTDSLQTVMADSDLSNGKFLSPELIRD